MHPKAVTNLKNGLYSPLVYHWITAADLDSLILVTLVSLLPLILKTKFLNWKSSFFYKGIRFPAVLEMPKKSSFFSFFRMSTERMEHFLSFVAPLITKRDTNFRKVIPPAQRLMLTLWFLASGTCKFFWLISFAWVRRWSVTWPVKHVKHCMRYFAISISIPLKQGAMEKDIWWL